MNFNFGRRVKFRKWEQFTVQAGPFEYSLNAAEIERLEGTVQYLRKLNVKHLTQRVGTWKVKYLLHTLPEKVLEVIY